MRRLLVCAAFICIAPSLPCKERTADLTGTFKPLAIPGARIGNAFAALSIAQMAYAEKVGKSATVASDRTGDASVVTLGYSVNGIGKRGDKIWEARVLTKAGELRSIMWVNPHTEKVRFLCGPWEEEKED